MAPAVEDAVHDFSLKIARRPCSCRLPITCFCPRPLKPAQRFYVFLLFVRCAIFGGGIGGGVVVMRFIVFVLHDFL